MMGIRLKIFSIIGLVFLTTSVITWIATVTLVQSQYIDLEAENVKKDTSRGVAALNNKVDQLALKTPDWASWDDTYQFIVDHNKPYIVSNIQSQGLQNLEINFMLFYNDKHQLIFSTGTDIETGEDIPIPKELTDAFMANNKLLAKAETDEHQGIIGTSTLPILIASGPILHSDTTGPVRGTLVFAQYLKPSDVSKLGEITHLDLAFDPAVKGDGSLANAASGTSAKTARTQTADSKTINGYQIVNDIYGQPLLVANVKEPRSIFQETKRTLIFYMLVVLGVSLSAILVAMYTTGRIVRQNRTMESERANKKEIEKQVVDRTREAKEEHARLSSAIESLDVGLLMTFNDRAEISYNNALLKILDTSPTDLKSQITTPKITLETIEQKLKNVPNFNLEHLIDQCQSDGQTFHIKELTYDNRILTVFGAPIM
ncbi:MAG: CHASE4 domain-containing protein, partial [Patescibacteria group bacterium]